MPNRSRSALQARPGGVEHSRRQRWQPERPPDRDEARLRLKGWRVTHSSFCAECVQVRSAPRPARTWALQRSGCTRFAMSHVRRRWREPPPSTSCWPPSMAASAWPQAGWLTAHTRPRARPTPVRTALCCSKNKNWFDQQPGWLDADGMCCYPGCAALEEHDGDLHDMLGCAERLRASLDGTRGMLGGEMLLSIAGRSRRHPVLSWKPPPPPHLLLLSGGTPTARPGRMLTSCSRPGSRCAMRRTFFQRHTPTARPSAHALLPAHRARALLDAGLTQSTVRHAAPAHRTFALLTRMHDPLAAGAPWKRQRRRRGAAAPPP